jgi:hypothetical protein
MRNSALFNEYSSKNNIPLTDDQIKKLAPAVFAEAPHETRSQRYGFIPTAEIINGMRQEGFMPMFVQQMNSRLEGREVAAKHIVRFRHQSQTDLVVGHTQPEHTEIVLLNSHDGTSAYKLASGVFRKICSNGLIVGKTCEELKVQHTAKAIDHVIEGSYKIISNSEVVKEKIEIMKAMPMPSDAKRAFGEAVLQLVYKDEEKRPEIDPTRIIQPRRMDRGESNLWEIFNNAQENIIRGGIQYTDQDEQGRRRWHTSREVKAIDRSVKINRTLWDLAEAVAAHMR